MKKLWFTILLIALTGHWNYSYGQSVFDSSSPFSSSTDIDSSSPLGVIRSELALRRYLYPHRLSIYRELFQFVPPPVFLTSFDVKTPTELRPGTVEELSFDPIPLTPYPNKPPTLFKPEFSSLEAAFRNLPLSKLQLNHIFLDQPGQKLDLHLEALSAYLNRTLEKMHEGLDFKWELNDKGREVRTFASGRKEILYATGDQVIQLPDGTKITRQGASPYRVVHSPDGTETAYLPNGNTQITQPDGTVVVQLPNGNKIFQKEGGYKYLYTIDEQLLGPNVEKRGDGTEVLKNPDETKVIRYPDGTSIMVSAQGVRTEVRPDGTEIRIFVVEDNVIQTGPDGREKVVVVKRRQRVIFRPDGTVETENYDGSTRRDSR